MIAGGLQGPVSRIRIARQRLAVGHLFQQRRERDLAPLVLGLHELCHRYGAPRTEGEHPIRIEMRCSAGSLAGKVHRADQGRARILSADPGLALPCGVAKGPRVAVDFAHDERERWCTKVDAHGADQSGQQFFVVLRHFPADAGFVLALHPDHPGQLAFPAAPFQGGGRIAHVCNEGIVESAGLFGIGRRMPIAPVIIEVSQLGNVVGVVFASCDPRSALGVFDDGKILARHGLRQVMRQPDLRPECPGVPNAERRPQVVGCLRIRHSRPEADGGLGAKRFGKRFPTPTVIPGLVESKGIRLPRHHDHFDGAFRMGKRMKQGRHDENERAGEDAMSHEFVSGSFWWILRLVSSPIRPGGSPP